MQTDYIKGTERVHWTDWKIGEIYYREGEDSPFMILDVGPYPFNNQLRYDAQYLPGPTVEDRKEYLIKAIKVEEEITTMTNKLYQVIGTETYGTYLAINSEGKYVLEMSGTKEVKAFSKTQVEEVLPWTFDVEFNDSRLQAYSYQGDKDSVKVGDLLFSKESDKFVFVVAVDTKSKKATKRFNGFKLSSVELN